MTNQLFLGIVYTLIPFLVMTGIGWGLMERWEAAAARRNRSKQR